jgi:hypothetical protein
MRAKFPSLLFLAMLLLMIPAAAGAANPQVCDFEWELPPFIPSSKDPVVFTFRGNIDYCSSMRVAAVGEPDILGIPVCPPGDSSCSGGFINIVLARRPGPSGVSCPAVEVPFELNVRMPELFPAFPPPSVTDIGLFLRIEDENGELVEQISCGPLGWGFTSEGYRHEIYFHRRFQATATWSAAGGSGLAYAVPAETLSSDSAQFWFFDPKNAEVMLKVLDGCNNNGHFWVIGAAATDVRYTLQIRDDVTGRVWEHTHPGGNLAPAFADIRAFPCDTGS